MSRFALGIVCVLGFSGFALAGPAEMFEEKEKDFGVSPKGTVLVHYFRFTNNTKNTVTLGQPRVSCGCVTPALSKNQQAVVAKDYAMTRGRVSIPVRKALLYHFQKRLRLDAAGALDGPHEAPVVIANREEFTKALADAIA